MGKELDCPFRSKNILTAKSVMMESDKQPCIRDKCAWWDEDELKCAVLVIARELRTRK